MSSVLRTIISCRNIKCPDWSLGHQSVGKRFTGNSIRSKISTWPFVSSSGDVTPVKLAYISYEHIQPSNEADKKPAVIILHDVMESKSDWQAFAQKLHTKTLRQVYAVDLRNHGDTYHDDNMTYIHMSEDVKTFMDAMQIKNACIIGNGMGGRVAMALALRCPEYIDRLAVIDASLTHTSKYHWKMSQYLETVAKLSLRDYTSIITARRAVETQLAREVRDEIARYVFIQNLVPCEVGGKTCIKWRIHLPAITKNLKHIIKFPVCKGKDLCMKPIIFIHDDKELHLTVLESTIVQRLFPINLIQGIPGAARFVQTQNPDDLMFIIDGFLTV